MLRKWLCGILVCALGVAMLGAALAEDLRALYIAGQDIMQDADHTLELGAGTAVFDPDTSVLTLMDATITATDYGIQADGFEGQTLTIVLAGENSIAARTGISSLETLLLQGDGKLVIEAEAYGISAGDITIDQAKLSITAQDACLYANSSLLRIQNGSELDLTNAGASSMGAVLAWPARIEIEDSVVMCDDQNSSCSIWTQSTLIITNSTVDVKTTNGTVVIASNLTVTDSQVTFEDKDNAGDAIAVRNVSVIGDSTLTVKGSSASISGTVTIKAPAGDLGEALRGSAVDGSDAKHFEGAAGKSPFTSDVVLEQADVKELTGPYMRIGKHEHKGVLVNAKEPTCTEEGYSADIVCGSCGLMGREGAPIPMIPHDFVDGKCTMCGAPDPAFVPENPPVIPAGGSSSVPSTGDDSRLTLWFAMLTLSAALGYRLCKKLLKSF